MGSKRMKIKKYNEMNKANFLHFTNDDENINVAYAPGYYFFGDELEDICIKCEIINSKIEFTVQNPPDQFLTSSDISEINKDLKKLSKKLDGWEFFDFYKDTEMKISDFYLVSDKPSETFNIINNKDNLKNINRVEKELN